MPDALERMAAEVLDVLTEVDGDDVWTWPGLQAHLDMDVDVAHDDVFGDVTAEILPNVIVWPMSTILFGAINLLRRRRQVHMHPISSDHEFLRRYVYGANAVLDLQIARTISPDVHYDRLHWLPSLLCLGPCAECDVCQSHAWCDDQKSLTSRELPIRVRVV